MWLGDPTTALHIQLSSTQRQQHTLMGTLESIALGVVALLIIFWIFPGIKPAMEKAEKAEKDWKGLLIPILGVVLFIFFLIASVS